MIEETRYFGDFECLFIVQKLSLVSKYLDAPKKIRLYGIGVQANLYSMTVVNKKGELKMLRRSPHNDRM